MAKIICNKCAKEFGEFFAPDSAAIKKALAGTAFAGLAGIIPANVIVDLSSVLTFVCQRCHFEEIFPDGKQG